MNDEDLYIDGKLNERRHQDDHDYLKEERDRRNKKKTFFKLWN